MTAYSWCRLITMRAPSYLTSVPSSAGVIHHHLLPFYGIITLTFKCDEPVAVDLASDIGFQHRFAFRGHDVVHEHL